MGYNDLTGGVFPGLFSKDSLHVRGYYCFEGVDCSGKSSLAALTAESLRTFLFDREVVLREIPSHETALGAVIRSSLKDSRTTPNVEPLFAAERAATQEEDFCALMRGNYVIQGRTALSQYCYSDRPIEYLYGLNQALFLLPAIIFYVDVSAETVLERLQLKRASKLTDLEESRILTEKNRLEHLLKKYTMLLDMYQRRSDNAKVVVLDGSKTLEELAAECIKEILADAKGSKWRV
jgi:dTMP kinase